MEAVDHELKALRVRASQRQELAKLQARLPEVEGPCPERRWLWTLEEQLALGENPDRWAGNEGRPRPLKIAKQAGVCQDAVYDLEPRGGGGDALQVADIHAVGQAQVPVSFGVVEEEQVEPQEPVQVPQVHCCLLSGGRAQAPLLLEDALNCLAEREDAVDVEGSELGVPLRRSAENAGVVVAGELFKVNLIESV